MVRPMARVVVRTFADAGASLVFAPERHVAARLLRPAGVPLRELVVERLERVAAGALAGAVVVDTTHARDGLLDLAAARGAPRATSDKKRVRAGDLLVSRLRPYLRQIALAHTAVMCDEVVACSTEFHVLAATDRRSLAFLLPFLLGRDAQAALAAGQEGGHHPRVPRETLLGLRVPRALLARHVEVSARVEAVMAELHSARARYLETLGLLSP
jgi:hypothetical protein